MEWSLGCQEIMKTRQENVDLWLGLANLRCVCTKLLMYEHYSEKVYLRLQILELPSIGEYWYIYGVPD